ncbi:hypothetical protein CR513_33707, partial [Mucuna pruriens]
METILGEEFQQFVTKCVQRPDSSLSCYIMQAISGAIDLQIGQSWYPWKAKISLQFNPVRPFTISNMNMKLHEKVRSHMEKKVEQYEKHANKSKKERIFKEGLSLNSLKNSILTVPIFLALALSVFTVVHGAHWRFSRLRKCRSETEKPKSARGDRSDY